MLPPGKQRRISASSSAGKMYIGEARPSFTTSCPTFAPNQTIWNSHRYTSCLLLPWCKRRCLKLAGWILTALNFLKPKQSACTSADFGRRRLASQYSLKICSNLSNPARNCAFDERFTKLFDKRPNQIRPLGLRIKTDLSAIGYKQKDIFNSSISTVPPWLLKPPRNMHCYAQEKLKLKYVRACMTILTCEHNMQLHTEAALNQLFGPVGRNQRVSRRQSKCYKFGHNRNHTTFKCDAPAAVAHATLTLRAHC